jgi:hypothetical protein
MLLCFFLETSHFLSPEPAIARSSRKPKRGTQFLTYTNCLFSFSVTDSNQYKSIYATYDNTQNNNTGKVSILLSCKLTQSSRLGYIYIIHLVLVLPRTFQRLQRTIWGTSSTRGTRDNRPALLMALLARENIKKVNKARAH